MKNFIYLDGNNLRLEALFPIFDGKPFEVKISKAKQHANHELLFLNKRMRPTLESEEASCINIKAYAACYGKTYPKEIGTVVLILLLNASIKHAGKLRREFIDRLLTYINNAIVPPIHETNGDELSAMSEVVLVLSGDDHVVCYFKGKLKKMRSVLRELKLEKLALNKSEIAFLTNICCISAALSIFSLKNAQKLVKTADLCVAMNLEAIRGETGAFDKRLHEMGRPYPNQIISAENVRRLIEGSEFTTEKARIDFGGDHEPRCQDAVCIRAAPQTHGGVRDTIEWLKVNLDKEVNHLSYAVNPIIGYALDFMIIGLVDLGNISERRGFRLNDSHLTYGLPMNLVGENPGFNHGFPVVQAAATAILGELKLLALPSTTNAAIDPMSNTYNCATYQAAVKSLKVTSLLAKVIAIEMYMASQAMSLVKDRLMKYRFGKGTAASLAEFRRHVRVTRTNRSAVPDMVEADRLVTEEIILSAAEKAVGRLN